MHSIELNLNRIIPCLGCALYVFLNLKELAIASLSPRM